MSTTQDFRQLVVPIGALHKNAYNPNRMSARTFEAERESIREYGFIDPVTVRPHPTRDGEFEIIDGEHRWLAAKEEGIETVPINVLDNLTDSQAKKLTIILNETRGEADVALLGRLVADIRNDTDLADLMLGLPYSEAELEHLTELGSFDWDDFNDKNPPTDPPAPAEDHSTTLTFGSRKDLEKFHTLARIVDHERQTGGEAAAVLAALTETVAQIQSTG